MDQFKRQFTNTEGQFSVQINKNNLEVFFPRHGCLSYDMTDFTEEQQIEIFNSKVPEFMADRDFRSMSQALMNIQKRDNHALSTI